MRKPRVCWTDAERQLLIKQVYHELVARGKGIEFRMEFMPYVHQAQRAVLPTDRFREFMTSEETKKMKSEVEKLFKTALDARTRAAREAEAVITVAAAPDVKIAAAILDQIHRRPTMFPIIAPLKPQAEEDPMSLVFKGLSMMISNESKKITAQLEHFVTEFCKKQDQQIKHLEERFEMMKAELKKDIDDSAGSLLDLIAEKPTSVSVRTVSVPAPSEPDPSDQPKAVIKKNIIIYGLHPKFHHQVSSLFKFMNFSFYNCTGMKNNYDNVDFVFMMIKNVSHSDYYKVRKSVQKSDSQKFIHVDGSVSQLITTISAKVI